MQLAFSWWQLFDVLLSILWLISGVRDFMGKDPLIRLPFNQYERDPEYRAFWQKKNGVFYMLNSIAFLILTFTPVTSLIYRIIFGIAIVGGLAVSQMLTLYTTPVIFLWLDGISKRFSGALLRRRYGARRAGLILAIREGMKA